MISNSLEDTDKEKEKVASATNVARIQKYIELIDVIRKSRKKDKVNEAFSEILLMLDPKIKQIIYRFNIAGFSYDDIYQEAQIALRYKAIKDYDQTRGSGEGPYPFDKFAILCIRRHLSTILKSSYQNKKRALNFSVSLDQDRNVNGSQNSSLDDFMTLIEIYPQTKGSVLDNVEKKEYYKSLFQSVFDKLSDFEKEVFVLYVQKYSYEEMAKIINKNNKKNNKPKVDIKSIDNSLMRLKLKGKKILKSFEKEE